MLPSIWLLGMFEYNNAILINNWELRIYTRKKQVKYVPDIIRIANFVRLYTCEGINYHQLKIKGAFLCLDV